MTGIEEDFEYSLTIEMDEHGPERILQLRKNGIVEPDRLPDDYINETERKQIKRFVIMPVRSPVEGAMKPPISVVSLTETEEESIERVDVEATEVKSLTSPAAARHSPEKLKWEERLENIKIIKNLGKGEFGKVDLAIAGPDGNRKLYAVKSMKDVKDDPILADHAESLLELFQNEIAILMKLKHCRIVEAKGVDIQSTPFLVLTYYENGSLLEYLKEKNTSISQEQREIFLIEIAEGVAFLQSKRIIHRDIASRNCLLDIGLHIVICDFGFAVELEEETDEYIDAWEWRTYRFLPPEVFTGNAYSMKTDIFSIGVVIYEIYANGVPPFDDLFQREGEDMNPLQKEVYVLNFWGNQDCVLAIPPPCPKKMVKIAHDCWEVNPDRRPTIEALLGKFQECK